MSIIPGNRAPDVGHYPSSEAPYKWDELSETAKQREIVHLFYPSNYPVRRFYQMGQQWTQLAQGTTQEDNWVVRWFLWHSFRYRDNRDNRTTNSTAGGHGQGGE